MAIGGLRILPQRLLQRAPHAHAKGSSSPDASAASPRRAADSSTAQEGGNAPSPSSGTLGLKGERAGGEVLALRGGALAEQGDHLLQEFGACRSSMRIAPGGFVVALLPRPAACTAA